MKDDLREAVARAIGEASGYPHSDAWYDAADAAIAEARPVIEREATAAIVQWLRDPTNIYGPHLYLADAIERNEHLPAKPLDT